MSECGGALTDQRAQFLHFPGGEGLPQKARGEPRAPGQLETPPGPQPRPPESQSRACPFVSHPLGHSDTEHTMSRVLWGPEVWQTGPPQSSGAPFMPSHKAALLGSGG